ncbi:MAG TPA: hypothetical protein VGE98_08340 [Thermoanaerobaculia bacterium]
MRTLEDQSLHDVLGGTFPSTFLPNHCATASCHGICDREVPRPAARQQVRRGQERRTPR